MVNAPRDTDGWTRPQIATALGIGAVLTLVGLLGFVLVPEEGELLGVFGVNATHNAFHVVTGVAGLAAGYYAGGRFAREYNRYLGIVYLLLVALWLLFPDQTDDLLNLDLADTLLHLGLGVVLAGVGFDVHRQLR